MTVQDLHPYVRSPDWLDQKRNLIMAIILSLWVLICSVALMVGIAWWDHHETHVDYLSLGGGRDLYPLWAILLVALLVAIARGYTPLVDKEAAVRRRTLLRSAVVVLIVALTGYIVNTWFFGLGLRIQKGEDSYWTYLTGLTPPIATMTWIGKGDSPLPEDAPCSGKDKKSCLVSSNIRYLGVADKTLVVYSVNDCRVYRLRMEDVSLIVKPRKPGINPNTPVCSKSI